MRQRPLSTDEIAEVLKALPDWECSEAWLRKTFNFPAFRDAMLFVNQVAGLAETANHHPDIYIRYRTVILILQTHSVNHQITNWDVELARQIELLPGVKGIHAA